MSGKTWMSRGRRLLTLVALGSALTLVAGCAPRADASPAAGSARSSSAASTIDLAGYSTAESGLSTYLDGESYLRGVNLYTLQQQRMLPTDQVTPDSQGSYDFLAQDGVSIVRLAVPWQRLQPWQPGEDVRAALDAPVDPAYLDLLEEQVERAGNAGIRVVLDLHNSCAFPWGTGVAPAGTIYCGGDLTVDDVLKVWRALSDRFEDDDRVAAYNLFNEPRGSLTGATAYFQYTQAIVDELRQRGDAHAVWIDSILLSSFAHDAPVGAPIDDPQNAIVYSQHFYLHGGTRADLLGRITTFAKWCSGHGVHCTMGELGWESGSSDEDRKSFELAYRIADTYDLDVTYFAATSAGDPKGLIAYSAEPGSSTLSVRRPQASVIEAHPSR
ncbi:cellulase family glycosylhydrolase [Rathayibacter sp. VKM Ac-2760]|uniref:glycoside hydrolase family 5 protein n=1 Tax=Rathayibacter sp. VKM Ac-2760 TaxID=2609253 RepID=UPI001319159D|nr:cellulase family glycosylhydrolase [Rathayibacter sp. VKM Ac-2760]QHC59325.1 cellulase family glycosylhydrolase [Rathayibacter sp. VKM Ac-2760]